MGDARQYTQHSVYHSMHLQPANNCAIIVVVHAFENVGVSLSKD